MTTTQGNIVRESSFAQDQANWQAARQFALTAGYGWLSLTAFHWLSEQPAVLEGLPGTWSVSDGNAVHSPLDGAPVVARVAEAASLDWIDMDGRLIELILRGGRYAIRVRDPKAALRTGFTGVPAFPADPDWVVAGRYVAFDTPRLISVDTARSDLRQQISVVGTVTVQVEGVAYALLAGVNADGTLSIVFHDDTNSVSTARWRSVGTSMPASDGALTVDFNRAVNMPFAFSDFGTCPAPPAGNRIGAAVTAGEKAPR